MQILGLLGMYFDAVVVEVKTFSLLFRLALAILWQGLWGIRDKNLSINGQSTLPRISYLKLNLITR